MFRQLVHFHRDFIGNLSKFYSIFCDFFEKFFNELAYTIMAMRFVWVFSAVIVCGKYYGMEQFFSCLCYAAHILETHTTPCTQLTVRHWCEECRGMLPFWQCYCWFTLSVRRAHERDNHNSFISASATVYGLRSLMPTYCAVSFSHSFLRSHVLFGYTISLQTVAVHLFLIPDLRRDF